MKQRLFYGTKDYSHQDITHLKDHTGQKHQNIKKQCACVQSCFSRVTLCHPIGSSLPGFSVRGIDSPSKNAGVGSHALLQGEGLFLTQGSTLHLYVFYIVRWVLHH